MGFTEKAYNWSPFAKKEYGRQPLLCDLENLKAMDCSLAKLYKQKTE